MCVSNSEKPTEFLHAKSLCHYMFITIYLWISISFIKCEFESWAHFTPRTASLSVSQPSCSRWDHTVLLSSVNRHKIYENLFENNTIHFDDCCCSIVCALPPQTSHFSLCVAILIWSIRIPSLIERIPFISRMLHWYATLLPYYNHTVAPIFSCIEWCTVVLCAVLSLCELIKHLK